jgi:N-acetylglutamate synthase-like GNAT family acetyltransferase
VRLADYSIHPAVEDDFPAIRTLIHKAGINPTGLKWSRFVVAISPGGNFLGCGQIKLHGDGSKELASIAVKEEERGRGIARAVIEHLLAREPSRPVYLMCRARLGALYARFGFIAIDFADMPPYFRNINRLAKIINGKARPENQLLVMRLG